MPVIKKSCETCKNAIWCETWTDWKCLVKHIRVYEPLRDAQSCESYKRKTRKEEVKCRCKDCLSRSGEDM